MSRHSLILLLSFFVVSCGTVCDEEPLAAQASPSGTFELFHVVRNCGATTSFGHSIRLGAAGSDPSSADQIFFADKVQELDAVWSAENAVEIRFESARIHNFKNFWYWNPGSENYQIVTAKLIEGT